MVIKQYDVVLINLEPTMGHEIKKSRPCLVISPDELNRNVHTLVIAPMTTRSHPYPTRIPVHFRGKKGWIMLDQIRCIDHLRVLKHLGAIERNAILEVKSALKETFVD